MDAFFDFFLNFEDLYNTPIELNEFRQYYYTGEPWKDEMKDLWSNGMHAYDQTLNGYINCAYAATIKNFQLIFDDPNATDRLITQIDEQIENLTAFKSNLTKIASTFNSIILKSTELIRSLDQFSIVYRDSTVYIEQGKKDADDFESMQTFYENLKQKLKETVKTIGNTQSIMEDKIEHMAKLKVQAKKTGRFVSNDVHTKLLESGFRMTFNLVKKFGKFLVRELMDWLVNIIDKLDTETIINAVMKTSPVLERVYAILGELQFQF